MSVEISVMVLIQLRVPTNKLLFGSNQRKYQNGNLILMIGSMNESMMGFDCVFCVNGKLLEFLGESGLIYVFWGV